MKPLLHRGPPFYFAASRSLWLAAEFASPASARLTDIIAPPACPVANAADLRFRHTKPRGYFDSRSTSGPDCFCPCALFWILAHPIIVAPRA